MTKKNTSKIMTVGDQIIITNAGNFLYINNKKKSSLDFCLYKGTYAYLIYKDYSARIRDSDYLTVVVNYRPIMGPIYPMEIYNKHDYINDGTFQLL